MAKQSQTLKGFRDFSPQEQIKRQWLIDRLRKIFELWGYDPMETPTLESTEIFEGQVGEDEKLFYKFQDPGGRNIALRYDQTVPICRYVGANHQSLPTPFKRYQIQNVYRAEKPQKGRFREFLQADADIFGIDSSIADAEVIALSLDIFLKLGFKNIKVLINDRNLLSKFPYKVLSSLDKIEKIGKEAVIKELVTKGVSSAKANEYIKKLNSLEPGENIKTIFSYLESLGFDKSLFEFSPNIIRSFSYSTGPIWEVIRTDKKEGSLLGGERFDNLVFDITGKKIPGTGFGLGFDRTLDAADELGLIPNIATKTKVLVTIFSEKHLSSSINALNSLRRASIPSEIYPDFRAKIQKQLKYADRKKIKYAVIIGPEEVLKNEVVVKNLDNKTQITIPFNSLLVNIK